MRYFFFFEMLQLTYNRSYSILFLLETKFMQLQKAKLKAKKRSQGKGGADGKAKLQGQEAVDRLQRRWKHAPEALQSLSGFGKGDCRGPTAGIFTQRKQFFTHGSYWWLHHA
jgi:hypothetical protein